MRDINRSRMAAAAKSRKVSPEELAEAKNRLKEIDAELSTLKLTPETKNGEERAQRYERVLRLREMRSEFTSKYPALKQSGPNGLILAAAMTILTILACIFFSGAAYFTYNALTYTSPPTSVASTYWSDLESQSYPDAWQSTLSGNLRATVQQNQFESDAQQADGQFGIVSAATLISPTQDYSKVTTATLIYKVTRTSKSTGAHITYNATLQFTLANTGWSINDLGASIYPTSAGVKPSASPSPTATTGQ